MTSFEFERQLDHQRAKVESEWLAIAELVATHPDATAALIADLDRFGKVGPVCLDLRKADLVGQLARLALAEVYIRVLESGAVPGPPADIHLHTEEDDHDGTTQEREGGRARAARLGPVDGRGPGPGDGPAPSRGPRRRRRRDGPEGA